MTKPKEGDRVSVLGGPLREVLEIVDIGKDEWWQCHVKGLRMHVWLDDISRVVSLPPPEHRADVRPGPRTM